MLEWYEACYFPPDLMLRRAGIDRRFTPLNNMTRMYARVPFTPGPAPGPLLQDHDTQPPSFESNSKTWNHHQQQQQQQQQQHQQQQQQQNQTQSHMNHIPTAGSTPTPPPSSTPSNMNDAMLQHMQQQHMLQQQLLRQQQAQLFAIQQQPHLSELEKAQLINKIMQLSILPPTSSPQPMPPKPYSTDIGMLLKQQQQEQQQQQQQQQQQHQQ